MEMVPPEQEPLPIREAGPPKGVLDRLDGYVALLTRVLFWIAGVGLVAMLLLIVADVIGIKIFSTPGTGRHRVRVVPGGGRDRVRGRLYPVMRRARGRRLHRGEVPAAGSS